MLNFNKFFYSKKFNFFILIFALLTIGLSFLWIFRQIDTYFLSLGGDPLIHLIFARNFASGYFFQFNIGEVSSAATSPIYVILLSLFYLLMGDLFFIIPKVISLISLIIIILTFYFQFKNKFSSLNLLLVILFFWVFPPVIFQSLYGMENILYTALVICLIANRKSLILNKQYIFFIPFLIFLRPESVFFIISCFFYFLIKKKYYLIIYLFLGGLLSLFIIVFLEFFYGFNNFEAGNSRRILNDLIPNYLSYFDIFSFKIYVKPLFSSIYLIPFLSLLLLNLNKLTLGIINFIFFIIFIPLLLHLLGIFPNSHFPRYFFLSYTLSIYLFIFFLSEMSFINSVKTFILSSLIIIICLIGFYRNSINEVIKNYDIPIFFENIKDENTKLYSKQIKELFLTKNEVLRIGTVEIQHKIFFDNNLEFYSLDGLINSNILNYNENKIINLEKFIIDNNINVLFPYPTIIGKGFSQVKTYPKNDTLYNLEFNKKTRLGLLFYEKKSFRNNFDLPFVIKVTNK